MRKKVKKFWTDKETLRFRQLYPTSLNKDLAKKFRRTMQAIRRKAIKLGIKKDRQAGYVPPQPPQNVNPWTKTQLEQLRNMYQNSSDREIALKLGRTPMSVRSKIKKLGLAKQLKKMGLKRTRRGSWTAEQVESLKNLCPVKTRAEIARQLGRTKEAVARMMQKLRLVGIRTYNRQKDAWTADEDAFLKEHSPKWPVEKIAEKLGRGFHAVRARICRKRFIGRKKNVLWTKQEISQLRYWLHKCSIREIAAKLGRPFESVNAKRKRLGLRIYEPWTKKEIAILKKFYPITTTAAVARMLGKSQGTIVKKARELELHKSVYVKRR